MGKQLTDLTIRQLPSSTRRREVADGRIGGLYLVLQPSGARSWALRYRTSGISRKLTLGPYPAIDLATARKLAQKAVGEVVQGGDPAAVKTQGRIAAQAAQRGHVDLVERVVDQFIERHAKLRTRDWGETARLLRKDVVAAWSGRRLSQIDRADVSELLDKIIDRGAPIGANRTFAQLRRMCRWAIERGIIEDDPCNGIRAPSTETARERVLDDDELRVVWLATAELGFPFRPIIQLLMLTGQRRGEVAGMRWSELDLVKALWTLPAERSKNRREHRIPLSPAVLDVLSSISRNNDGSDLVFTTTGRTPPSGWTLAKKQLDRAVLRALQKDAQASSGRNDLIVLLPWTIHDIRRSVASGMARIGVNLPVIERSLNHISGSFGGIVGVYQRHDFAQEMRNAFNSWGGAIDMIVSGQPNSNVVEFASGRT